MQVRFLGSFVYRMVSIDMFTLDVLSCNLYFSLILFNLPA
ncbi:hypothetical protein LEP1GSC073_0467 [Leptospira noguchii str. Cascata]|nr:hypothetical protein LEP1GSC073_0467 [Leptospira noguchii str. Cascata]